MPENSFGLEEQEWVYDRAYYEGRLKRLKREQDELAVEVIHYNNRRKFTLVCHCLESTMVFLAALASCYFMWMGNIVGSPMDYLSAGLIAAAIVVPLTVHNTIGWVNCIKEEKLRSAGIERLKFIQSEIDSIQQKVLY